MISTRILKASVLGTTVAAIVFAIVAVENPRLLLANAGFVAVDFYDGCLIYDFTRRTVWLCDLDCYRPSPYVLDRDRQYGSARFMAPEESAKGATIDERSTVFTLGRTAFVLLSRGPRGEEDRNLWRAGDALFQVATTATRPDPADRYQSVAELAGAWQEARSN